MRGPGRHARGGWWLGVALVMATGCDSSFLATLPDPAARLFPGVRSRDGGAEDWSNGCVPGQMRCVGMGYAERCVIGAGGNPGPSGELCDPNELCIVDHCQSLQSCEWPCPPDFQCGGDGRCVPNAPAQVQLNLETSMVRGQVTSKGAPPKQGPCSPANDVNLELVGKQRHGEIQVTARCQDGYAFAARVLRDVYELRALHQVFDQELDATGPEATAELDLASLHNALADSSNHGSGTSNDPRSDFEISVHLLWNGAPLPTPPGCLTGSAAFLRLRDTSTGEETKLSFPCANPSTSMPGHVRRGTWEATLFFDPALAARFGGPQWKGGVPMESLWFSGPGVYEAKLETRPVEVSVKVDGVPPADSALCALQSTPMMVQPSREDPERAVPLRRVCGRSVMTFQGFTPVGPQTLRLADPEPPASPGSLPLTGGADLMHFQLP